MWNIQGISSPSKPHSESLRSRDAQNLPGSEDTIHLQLSRVGTQSKIDWLRTFEPPKVKKFLSQNEKFEKFLARKGLKHPNQGLDVSTGLGPTLRLYLELLTAPRPWDAVYVVNVNVGRRVSDISDPFIRPYTTWNIRRCYLGPSTWYFRSSPGTASTPWWRWWK